MAFSRDIGIWTASTSRWWHGPVPRPGSGQQSKYFWKFCGIAVADGDVGRSPDRKDLAVVLDGEGHGQ
jgi:hypothetical protein